VQPTLAQSTADPKPIAERPWAAFWVASLARAMTDCDVIYDSIGRIELADSLEERLTSYRAFQGIDRTRPLGMMWTWDEEKDPPAFIFIPVQEIDELMKTATFGVVDYHKVNESQYEIERPGIPYHVIVRNGYAMFGEEVPAIHALRDAPERLTRDLRDKYDMVFMIDQRQVPKESKQSRIDEIRRQFEPWLQRQDDEPAESATMRRAIGKAALDAVDRLAQDIQTITIAARIDRRTRQLQVDVTLQAEQGSTTAAELNRLVVHKSEFSALVNRDASAGLAINWPVMLLGKDLLAIGGTGTAGRLDMGIQIVGADWSDMTLIAGVRGPEAIALNAALPSLLTRMEKSGELKSINRDIEKYRDVTVQALTPTRVPGLLQSLLPPDVSMLIGQGKQTTWLAAGDPDSLAERLHAAIDAVEDVASDEKTGSVMQGRLSVGKWPTVVPIVDPQETQDELRDSKDGFSIAMQPVRNGLKIQFVAEEGLLRVIGRHWAKQVEEAEAFRDK
jgi:hypothetical protein